VRLALFILGLLVAVPVAAQEPAVKKKKAPAKKQQVVHKKPTPEQIRKFNALQKKQRQ
jgi:hypothetical protein